MDQPIQPPTTDQQSSDSAAPAVQQQAQIQIDDSKIVACYANFCRVTGTPEELIIDFGLNPQPFGTPTEPICGTAETVHFVNWVLYSGYVDLADLIHKAEEVVIKEHKGEGEISLGDFNEYMTEPLQCQLEEALSEWVVEFAPDFHDCNDEYAESAARHYNEESYCGADLHGLIGPLFRSAIYRIDLEEAARHIIMQDMLRAKVSA